MKLIQILTAQLDKLVKDGLPELHAFYRDLEDAELISEDELRDLQVALALHVVRILLFTGA
ncbi:uncharacterized protein ATNIH1004_007328 [Aspergillus tanneri]|uniref:Uncharacterized protein n=1 Tax=Aspergillus tanneri TaxID=1220188 RepID=A0A5M9MTT1_9EURO|nr:uncharacterized protein ATNIH1004_007328 [Aspergillus tanneri]KAA8645907.1 hypothetical protein ATNIH1004_007328 [Aspergillus tanneri]